MAESSLGEYRVIVSADYAAFSANIEAITKAVQNSAEQITARMSAMTEAVGKSMGELSATMTASATRSAEQISAMNQSLGKIDATGAAGSVRQLSTETERIGPVFRSAAESSNIFSGALSKMRGHLEWLATAGIVGAFIGIPLAINKVTESTEALDAKIRQNLELSDRYHNNNAQLDADLKRLSETANTFAVGFGANINDVQEAMQILSRRFKDVESISYLTSVALTMNRLDFVDLKSAASNLEAVMLQFGLSAQGTKQFLNDFTIAVHTARITGQELLDALQRSGSAFKGFNMDSREAIAAVSALATETARTGSVIGQSFKSIASNFDTKKAVEALQAYNIELYTVNENGLKTMRDGANIFAELQNLFAKLDDEGKRKLALTLSGGKYQVNQLMAFLEDANGNFTNIMNEMKNKSSDEMTQELLATSMATYQTKIAQAKASLEVFARTIGTMVLPSLKTFMDYMTAAGIWLQQHAGAVLKVAQAIMYLGGAYVAIRASAMAASIVMGAYEVIVAAVTGAVSTATIGTWAFQAANTAATISTFAQIAATEGLAVALASLQIAFPPLLVLSGIIMALGAVLYEVYQNWESVQPALIGFWNGLVDYVATSVEILINLFPGLAVAFIVVQTVWDAVIQYLTGAWNQFVTILTTIVQAIYNLIVSVSQAWGPFVEGAKEGINNFASAIGEVVKSILPAWANNVLSILSSLASKIDAIATGIGNRIRSIFSIATGVAGGGSEPPESPFEKAQREAREAFDRIVASNAIPVSGVSTPEIGNQIPDDKKKKGRQEHGETEYQQAKKAYEAAVAKAQYETESSGKAFTSNDKLYLYQQYLEGVTKLDDAHHQETLDYEKGEYDLKTKMNREALDLKKAQLDKSIAEEKLTKRAAFDEEIKLLQEEVNLTLEGSVARVKAEKAVDDAMRRREDHATEIAKKEADINRQYLSDLQALIDKQIEFESKLHLISPEQVIVYKSQQNESTYASKMSNNEDAIGKTAMAGKEAEMIAAYRQYTQAKTQADRDAAEQIMLNLSKQDTKTQEIITKGEQDWASYEKRRQELSQQTFEYINRYQIAGLNAFQTGVRDSMNGILNKTKSTAEAIRNIFSSLWKAVTNQLSTDFAQKWTQSMSKLIFGSKDADNQIRNSKQQLTSSLAQEAQKQVNADIQASQTKATTSTVADTAVQASAQATTSSVTASLGQMMAQMLEMMAIMFVISALFGGGGSSKSESTSSVSLGRSPTSYYTTPAAVPQLTVPSFDTGAMTLPEDMLAMVHKNEMILTPELADNIRSLGSSGGVSNNQKQQRPFIVNNRINASAIDGRGMKDALNSSSRDVANTIKREARRFNTNINGKWI